MKQEQDAMCSSSNKNDVVDFLLLSDSVVAATGDTDFLGSHIYKMWLRILLLLLLHRPYFLWGALLLNYMYIVI